MGLENLRSIVSSARNTILSLGLVGVLASCNGDGTNPPNGGLVDCSFNPAIEYVQENNILEGFDVSGFGTYCKWNPNTDAGKSPSSFLDPFEHNRTREMLDWMTELDNDDFYIDLLFYNRKLKKLIAIDLKIGDFKAEYKGQMELYLRWLNRYERQEDEGSPIGIILCTGKKEEQIELLELDKSNIHVAEYLTVLPPKEVLRAKLNQAIEISKDKLNRI
jgi:hypothetical protein